MTRTGSIPLSAGSIIAEKYRLEKPLARGGMGSVWVATHIALDEPVAIKLINRSAYQYGEVDARLRQDAEMRLQREAKSAARLRSPHIVQLLDYGVDRGTPYIVMELLEGEHLGARLRRKGRLSLHSAAGVAEQVAKALRRAHKAGIIHRDLKPDNIFLARIDDEEIVKLLDFGLVKAVRGTLSGEPTQSDMLMGSLYYMSPEQTLGFKDIDHRTDLWSLAVILFEVITGVTPFSGASIVDVILKIRSGPIPLATEVAPDLPPSIDVFFDHALQRDPGRRFASARAMVTELAALVRELGPRARRVGEPPAPDSQRITMEIGSSEFLEVVNANDDLSEDVAENAAEDLGGEPFDEQSSDAAPTARKPASTPRGGRSAPVMTRSIELAPTSIVPREASSPDLSASRASPSLSRSRRMGKVPDILAPAVVNAQLDEGQVPSSIPRSAAAAGAPSSSRGKAPPLPKVLPPPKSPPPRAPASVRAGAASQPAPPASPAKGASVSKNTAPIPAVAPPPPSTKAPRRAPTLQSPVMASSSSPPRRSPSSTRSRGSGMLPPVLTVLDSMSGPSGAPIASLPEDAPVAPVRTSGAVATPAEPSTEPAFTKKMAAPPRMMPSEPTIETPAPVMEEGLHRESLTESGVESLFARIIRPSEPTLLKEKPDESAFARLASGSTLPAPPDAPAPPNAGRMLKRKGSLEVAAAADLFKKPEPLQSAPKGSVAELIDQGFAALRAGNRARARQCWEEAQRHDPENRALQLNLRKLEAKGH